MTGAFIVAGRRTPVAPRGGGLSTLEVAALGAPVIQQALADANLHADQVDDVILGNALYGGGNPARVVALAAGIPEAVGAMTIDTQCCSSLDAIGIAAARVTTGAADIAIAGGIESYSRAPIRQIRPRNASEVPIPYDAPPFTPWPDRNPDMIESAATLAADQGIARTVQEAYAVESHRRSREDSLKETELVTIVGITDDEFTRVLSPALCRRLPVLAGTESCGLTSATTAVEADAAAIIIVANANAVREKGLQDQAVAIRGSASHGGDPACPALAPIDAAKILIGRLDLEPHDFDHVEMMEAFAVQAIACIDGIGLDPIRVNKRGGALARGHPVGASGAILGVRLYHDLLRSGTHGLAAIAAAGGLGSALVLAG
jgi:acetyl-CoA C-acetyltransferase